MIQDLANLFKHYPGFGRNMSGSEQEQQMEDCKVGFRSNFKHSVALQVNFSKGGAVQLLRSVTF